MGKTGKTLTALTYMHEEENEREKERERERRIFLMKAPGEFARRLYGACMYSAFPRLVGRYVETFHTMRVVPT